MRAGAAAAALAAAAVAPSAAAAELPAGRAYELVSPLASDGQDFSIAWVRGDGASAVMLSGGNMNEVYVSRRSAERWTAAPIALPAFFWAQRQATYVDATDDESRLLMRHNPPSASSPTHLAIREPDGSWRDLGGPVRYVGRSADARRVVVEPTSASATPYAEIGRGSGVFLWDDGQLSTVGTDAARIARCGATVTDGNGLHGLRQSGVSSDGRTIVLTSRSCFDADSATTLQPHVFVWRDGQTIDITAPLPGEPDSPSTYVGNAVDGSAVFVRTAARLVAGDANGVEDLYRYDVATGALERIAASLTDAGATLHTAIASEDGARVWFVARPDPAATTDTLNVWTRGAGVRTALVAGAGSVTLSSIANATQLTPDGSVIAWTGTTQAGGLPVVTGTHLYRATAAGGDAVCVTCANGNTVGNVTIANSFADSGLPRRRMSDDGRHLFFESNRALVPADDNGQTDVYGYSDGALWLVTSGRDPNASAIAGVTARGDVLFRTYAQLLPWADDPHQKVYAAWIGGGQPAPAGVDPACDGDACQGEPQMPPAFAPPGSATFEGPGDVDEPEQPFAPDANPRARLALAKIGATAKRRLGHGKTIALTVRSSEAGRVTATVRARIGGRWLQAAVARRTFADAGRAQMRVRLAPRVRRELARRGALRVRVTVQHRRGVRAVGTQFVLRASHAAAGGRRADA